MAVTAVMQEVQRYEKHASLFAAFATLGCLMIALIVTATVAGFVDDWTRFRIFPYETLGSRRTV